MGVWTTVSRLMGNPTLLPSPLTVLRTLGDLICSGALFVNSGTSLGRIVLSWLLAALVAIPLGIAMGRSGRSAAAFLMETYLHTAVRELEVTREPAG